jgi:hypothetical protein
MKNQIKPNVIIFIFGAILVLITSCSSSRIFKAPYNKVSDIAKKEFFQNNWTKKSTKRSKITEWKNGLEIELYEWEFPNVKIYCEVEVVKKSDGLTKVYVFIQDCNSWWFPFNFNPQMATELLDSFEKQLKWYKLGSMEKPWDKFNKEK